MQLRWSEKPHIFLSKSLLYAGMIFGLLCVVILVEDSLSLIPFFKSNSHKVAAFVEETVRCLAILIGSTFAIAFTIVFASLEMISYVNGAINAKGSLPIDYMVFRMLCINVHLLCLLAQLYGFQLYRKYNNGTYWAIGYLSAVFFHLIWNQGLGYYVLMFVKLIYKSAVMALGS